MNKPTFTIPLCAFVFLHMALALGQESETIRNEWLVRLFSGKGPVFVYSTNKDIEEPVGILFEQFDDLLITSDMLYSESKLLRLRGQKEVEYKIVVDKWTKGEWSDKESVRFTSDGSYLVKAEIAGAPSFFDQKIHADEEKLKNFCQKLANTLVARNEQEFADLFHDKEKARNGFSKIKKILDKAPKDKVEAAPKFDLIKGQACWMFFGRSEQKIVQIFRGEAPRKEGSNFTESISIPYLIFTQSEDGVYVSGWPNRGPERVRIDGKYFSEK